MGCLMRLGCLVILCIAAVVGWFTRDHWMPEKYRARFSMTSGRDVTWEPLTDAGVQRTRDALSKLSQPRGPVFQTLSGADVASYVFRELSKQFPASADSIEARVVGERVAMRAVVNMSELADIGAIGGMLGEREHVELAGTMRVVRPGLGELQVQEAKIRGLTIPRGMVSTLLRRFGRGPRPDGVSGEALPLPLPTYVGDIRVANGRITLYKNVQ